MDENQRGADYRLAGALMPRIYTRRPLSERFHEMYRVEPDSGCWIWTGPTCGKGYGSIGRGGRGGKIVMAHRASYELHSGPIPTGMLVCHKCDRPPCCNPTHLFLGTHKDNNQDCIAKGRKRQVIVRGEMAGRAKLTAAEVVEIRASTASAYAVAPKYGVSRQLIQRIRQRLIWKHIP